MRLIFLLSLAVSARAGVVAPIEAGIAPVGPAVPAAFAGGVQSALPNAGGFGLTIPTLPMPAPGLISGFLHDGAAPVNFAPSADATPVDSSAARPQGAAPTAKGSHRRPVVPGEDNPGVVGARVVVSERREGRNAATSAASEKNSYGSERAVLDPVVENADGIRVMAPESGAAFGRRYWDQSGSASELGGVDLPASFSDAKGEETAFSGGHSAGTRRGFVPGGAGSFASEAEGLRDAVGSPFAARVALSGGAPAWRTPNLTPGAPSGLEAFPSGRPTSFSAAAGAGVLPSVVPAPVALPRVPERLALFVFGPRLSVTLGLTAAPNGEAVTAPAIVPVAPVRPIGSTEWLERASLLEAVSASESYARPTTERAAAALREGRAVVPATAAVVPSRALPWWSAFLLFLLPVAALLRRS